MEAHITIIKTADSRQQTADSRQQTADSRCHYFDFLRIAAAFGVIVMHTSMWRIYLREVNSFSFLSSIIYTYLCEWSVPVFVMISGGLFLSRDIPIRKIYGKYIFRIFTAFIFWSFVYSVLLFIFKKAGFLECLKHFIKGNYHMWFLFMIAWMYAVMPIAKKIAESEHLAKYFIVLWFISFIVLPQSANIAGLFSKSLRDFMKEITDSFYFGFTMGFTGYFILGYKLNNTEISARTERLIYAAGIFSFLASCMTGVIFSRITGNAYTSLRGNNIWNVFESIAVFVFFMKHFRSGSKLIAKLSQYSFGVYLVHDAAIQFVIKICRVTPFSFNAVLSVLVISVIVFVISFAISAVLNHIPFINKYIV